MKKRRRIFDEMVLLLYASNNKRDVCLTQKIEYEKANMEYFGPVGCIKRQPEEKKTEKSNNNNNNRIK